MQVDEKEDEDGAEANQRPRKLGQPRRRAVREENVNVVDVENDAERAMDDERRVVTDERVPQVRRLVDEREPVRADVEVER